MTRAAPTARVRVELAKYHKYFYNTSGLSKASWHKNLPQKNWWNNDLDRR